MPQRHALASILATEQQCQQKTMRQQSVSKAADSFKAIDSGAFRELSALSVKFYIDILFPLRSPFNNP